MMKVFLGRGNKRKAFLEGKKVLLPTADRIREAAAKMMSERDSITELMNAESFETPYDDPDAFQ
jgi:hypothetical protein